MRKLIMLGMLLASFGANAAPVSLANTYTEWHWFSATYAGGAMNTLNQGDAYPRNVPSLDRTQISEGPIGDATSRTYASREFDSQESDDSFSFQLLVDMGVEAEVDAGVVPTIGPVPHAVAQMSLERMFVFFEVLEPVVYTGTLGLHVGTDSAFTPGAVEFASGSVLQAGRYFASFHGGGVSVSVQSGQSDAASITNLYDFNFVAVPLPGPLALVFFGLLGIGLRKKVAGGRTLAT